MISAFINLHTHSKIAARGQRADRLGEITNPPTDAFPTPTTPDGSNKHAAMKVGPSKARTLTEHYRLIICTHILVSQKCLLDILSGVPYPELLLKYPRSKDSLEDYDCTNIWKLNRRAAQNRIQKRSLKAFLLTGWKKAIQDPPRIVARHYLLFAPSTHEIDVPLSTFLTKERVSQVLCGLDIGICRHMRCSDAIVLDCYEPEDCIDRDRCGPGHPCTCAEANTDWGGWECLEIGCQAEFYFSVLHMIAANGRLLLPAEQCECLTLVTARSFPYLETGMDPSWTGCAIAPDEIDAGSIGFRRWDTHQIKCYEKNREWYNQASVESLNQRAGTKIAHYCGKPSDYAAALEMAAQSVRQPGGVEPVSEVSGTSADLPPRYSLVPNAEHS
jgi:hypothetical protein